MLPLKVLYSYETRMEKLFIAGLLNHGDSSLGILPANTHTHTH